MAKFRTEMILDPSVFEDCFEEYLSYCEAKSGALPLWQDFAVFLGYSTDKLNAHGKIPELKEVVAWAKTQCEAEVAVRTANGKLESRFGQFILQCGYGHVPREIRDTSLTKALYDQYEQKEGGDLFEEAERLTNEIIKLKGPGIIEAQKRDTAPAEEESSGVLPADADSEEIC